MGSVGLLLGRSVHGFIAKNGWDLTVEIGTTEECRNVMAWTTLICGSAHHAYSEKALSFFRAMQKLGVKPNEKTFSGILNECAHEGLVDEGRKYFYMIKRCGVEPRIQHYGCMVDLFGKAELLE
ncbi:hypothetical protein REPUB_Repub09cG0055800 [Reevesia pubescens]